MKHFLLCLLIIFTLLLSSCSTEIYNEIYNSKTIFAMDAYVNIKLGSNTSNCNDIFLNCDIIIKDIENILSKNNLNSDVSKFNSSPDQIQISDITKYVIRTAIDISLLTDGAFDITLLPVSEYWEECADNGNIPNNEELSSILSCCGYKMINISDNLIRKSNASVKIDLGGIGKGYASDVLVEYLKSSGVDYGMVSFGSNVAVWGQKPDGTKYRIGIKNPFETSSLIGYINMSNGSLSVSGDYERYVEINGEKYHHITDPATGYPTNNGVHSVAVVCEKGIYADALSTAFMVMGVEKTLELYDLKKFEFEVLFVTDDGIVMSDGMKEIFEPVA